MSLGIDDITELLEDPIKFGKLCWPEMVMYSKQRDIIYSVRDNKETIAVAGNQLGKDFIAAFIVLWFFMSRSPCRIVTSSSGHTQLQAVLWGEIRRFLNTSVIPLPLRVNDLALKQVDADGNEEPRSYVRGIVTNTPENLLGHHLSWGRGGKPRTLFVADEGSSIENEYYSAADTWAHRKLIIGNPLPCANPFKEGVKQGDLPRDPNDLSKGYYRKIIQIKAVDSPNVQLALRQKEQGLEVTHEELVPGVISYSLYLERRALWDPIRQKVGLDAEFYEGAEVLLFPPEWLRICEQLAELYKQEGRKRKAKSIGCDPGEGGANTAWSVVDELGLIYQESIKTPDTSVITGRTIGLMQEFGVAPEQVLFDRGGGGKQHADRLRAQGYNVRTVAFGEPATSPEARPTATRSNTATVRDEREARYVYFNRRAEMYGLIRLYMDPIPPVKPTDDEPLRGLTNLAHTKVATRKPGFAIPAQYVELYRQLAPLPLLYDAEGRIYLPPKNKKDKESKQQTLIELLGCSPDEADSLALAVFGLAYPRERRLLGAW